MADSDPLQQPHTMPTASRPLLGLTILVVEDSRYASETMRLLCLRSGARIRRADCLKSARRHLQVYRPSAVIVDLGLPDGSGLDLISELNRAAPRVGILLATSGDDNAEQAAMAAGADDFLDKPITSLALFQSVIIGRLPPERRPFTLHPVSEVVVEPDPIALQDDLAHVADVLSADTEGGTLDYLAQFIGGIARSVDDTPLAEAADNLAKSRRDGTPVGPATALIAGLVNERLQQRKAI